MSRILGIDIGGVIRGPKSVEVVGAIENIARIHTCAGFDHIYLLSQTLLGSRWFINRWLSQRDFWARTGIKKVDALYCNYWWEKTEMAREISLTHIIDDRSYVLSSMPDSVTHCFLFGSESQEGLPDRFYCVPDWEALTLQLLCHIAT